MTVDALRGIAALAVCLFHFEGSGLPKISTPGTAGAFSWGSHGVDIFFVISGFVIPYVLLRSAYTWRDAPRFLARRFLRVAPPAYVLLILTVAQYWFIDRIFGNQRWFGNLTWQEMLANFTFLVPFTGQIWLNGVFWTLSIEFQYYLILSFTFPFITRYWLSAIAVVILISFVSYLTHGVNNFFDYVGCFMLGGIVLAFKERAIAFRAMLFISAFALIMVYYEENLLSVLFGGGAAIVLCFARIDNRVLTFLGKISYSLYLTHILVGSSTEFVLTKIVTPSGLASRILLQSLCLAAALIAATFFYYLVECHFVALSQRIRSSATGSGGGSLPGLSTAAAEEGSAA